VDSSAVSRTEIIVDPSLASRNEPMGVHAEVGTHVDQELPFTNPVGDEKRPVVVAQRVPPLMSAALFSLLALVAGRSTLLCSGSKAAMILAEDGCSVFSGGGSAA
jgi:hypothetical protein